ncbi:hypothetical protein RUND412_010640 [Rhizina undulata]
MEPSPLIPSHKTKSTPLLHYPILPTSLVLTLTQSDTAENTTGSTLWLGSQLLSLYLTDIYYKAKSLPAQARRNPRAIELGAGVGLTSLVLASLGFDVLATDLPVVIKTVLSANVTRNKDTVMSWGLKEGRETGEVVVGELDWYSADEDLEDSREEARSGVAEGYPFDLIVTSDTLYHESLIMPLLQTLRALSRASRMGKKFPLILLGLEKRDPWLIAVALEKARSMGFECRKILPETLEKVMRTAGVMWQSEDWEGVEIWKWKFKQMTARKENKLR